ncbi:hypothetical protein VUR80DRAFT_5973 [Thermomyces stellatus]
MRRRSRCPHSPYPRETTIDRRESQGFNAVTQHVGKAAVKKNALTREACFQARIFGHSTFPRPRPMAAGKGLYLQKPRSPQVQSTSRSFLGSYFLNGCSRWSMRFPVLRRLSLEPFFSLPRRASFMRRRSLLSTFSRYVTSTSMEYGPNLKPAICSLRSSSFRTRSRSASIRRSLWGHPTRAHRVPSQEAVLEYPYFPTVQFRPLARLDGDC